MSLPTLPPSPSALPDAWIDRLFAELLTMYGKHWIDLWVDTDVAAVKAGWAAALSGMDGACIRLALDSLRTTGKPFPPTQPEFVALCRQFVRKGSHRLSLAAPRHDAPANVFERMRAHLVKP